LMIDMGGGNGKRVKIITKPSNYQGAFQLVSTA
jgi:hypothetical protein